MKCIQVYRKEVILDLIVQLIGQYAFPIAACIAMGWYVKYSHDYFRKDYMDIMTKHKEEMDTITAAVNNNTAAINSLITYIRGANDDNRY